MLQRSEEEASRTQLNIILNWFESYVIPCTGLERRYEELSELLVYAVRLRERTAIKSGRLILASKEATRYRRRCASAACPGRERTQGRCYINFRS